MNRKRFGALALVFLLLFLAACGDDTPIELAQQPTPLPVATAPPTPEPTPEPVAGPRNPLTGLPVEEIGA